MLEEIIEYLIVQKNVNQFIFFSDSKIQKKCVEIIMQYKQFFENISISGIKVKNYKFELCELLCDKVIVLDLKDKTKITSKIIELCDFCVFVFDEKR